MALKSAVANAVSPHSLKATRQSGLRRAMAFMKRRMELLDTEDDQDHLETHLHCFSAGVVPVAANEQQPIPSPEAA